MLKRFLLFSCFILLALVFTPDFVQAQTLPNCSVERVVPDSSGNMAFTIKGDKDFYVGNAQFVLHIGKSVFTLNDQDGPYLTFYIPVREFKTIPEGAQIFLKYGEAHSDEDEEILADACRRQMGHYRSLGLFSKDMIHR